METNIIVLTIYLVIGLILTVKIELANISEAQMYRKYYKVNYPYAALFIAIWLPFIFYGILTGKFRNNGK